MSTVAKFADVQRQRQRKMLEVYRAGLRRMFEGRMPGVDFDRACNALRIDQALIDGDLEALQRAERWEEVLRAFDKPAWERQSEELTRKLRKAEAVVRKAARELEGLQEARDVHSRRWHDAGNARAQLRRVQDEYPRIFGQEPADETEDRRQEAPRDGQSGAPAA